MYGTPTLCHTLDCIFLTTKMVLKNNVETLSADTMAYKFSFEASLLEYPPPLWILLFLYILMGEGSCVLHPFPSFILKLGRKRISHSSNLISPYPTPIIIILKNSQSVKDLH